MVQFSSLCLSSLLHPILQYSIPTSPKKNRKVALSFGFDRTLNFWLKKTKQLFEIKVADLSPMHLRKRSPPQMIPHLAGSKYWWIQGPWRLFLKRAQPLQLLEVYPEVNLKQKRPFISEFSPSLDESIKLRTPIFSTKFWGWNNPNHLENVEVFGQKTTILHFPKFNKWKLKMMVFQVRNLLSLLVSNFKWTMLNSWSCQQKSSVHIPAMEGVPTHRIPIF